MVSLGIQADVTVVGGRVVVQDGKLCGIEEEMVAEAAQKAALRMMNDTSLRTGMSYRKSRKA